MALVIRMSLLIVLLLHVSQILANSEVVQNLDTLMTQSLVMDSSEPWLLIYHGANHNLDPFLEEVKAKTSTYGISIGKVDCSKYTKMCKAHSIPIGDIPTVKMVTEKPSLNPYSRKLYRASTTFVNDILDMSSLTRFIAKSYPSSLITSVKSVEGLDTFLEANPELLTALLFSDKSTPSMIFRTIALRFKGSINCVHIPLKSATDVSERYSIDSTSIGVLAPQSDALVTFDGADLNSRAAIVLWLSTFVPTTSDAASADTGAKADTPSQSADNKYASTEFSVDTLSVDVAWMVAVVEKGAEMSAPWSDAVKGCHGYIQSAEIVCSSEDRTVEIDVSGDSVKTGALSFGQQACQQAATLPSILTMKHGAAARKKLSSPALKWGDVLTEMGEHKRIVKTLGDSLPKASVSGLYEETMPQFVAQGMEKGLLTYIFLSDGSEAPGVYKNIAMTYASIGQFGFLSAPSKEMLTRSKITKLPTVIALTPISAEEMKGNPQQGPAMRIILYDTPALGPMKFESLGMFVTAIYRQSADLLTKFQPEQVDESFEMQELITVKTEVDWTEHCGEAFRGICLVGLLAPSSSSSDTLQGTETLMSAMAAMGKSGSAFRFLSVDAVCQQDFVGSFGVQGEAVPTVAIYSPSKRRYQLMKGSFSETNIKDFALALLSGKSTTVPMSLRPVVESECAAVLDSKVEDSAESSEEMEEFLREIQREEAEKAAQRKLEILEEKKALEEAKKKPKKKNNKKKKAKAKK